MLLLRCLKFLKSNCKSSNSEAKNGVKTVAMMCTHAQSLSRVQFCATPYCSLPGSSVHGIILARKLGWVAIFSSRGSSWPRERTHVSCVFCIVGGFFTAELPGKPLVTTNYSSSPHPWLLRLIIPTDNKAFLLSLLTFVTKSEIF